MKPDRLVNSILENEADDFDVQSFIKRNFKALGPPDRSHLHSSIDGGLYDTRKPEWFKGPPLRHNYQRFHSEINNVNDFKATWRARGMANYPLAFMLSDGAFMCEQCVQENLRRIIDSTRTKSNDGWRVVGVGQSHGATDEPAGDEDATCVHCGKNLGEIA